MGVETVNSAILWLAILFFVLGLGLMIVRGALSRNKVDTLYGVGQIKSRQVKFREMMTGLLLWVVGLVLLGMWWLLTSGVMQRVESQPIEQVVQVESTADGTDEIDRTDPTLPPPVVATDTAVHTPTPTMVVLATATGQVTLPPESLATEMLSLATLSPDELTAAFESTLPPPPTIAPTAAATITPTAEVEGVRSAKVNIEYVNVRTEPTTESDILTTLAQADDEILGVYQWTEEGEGYKWRQVETYAGTGWVVEDYLTFIEE